MLNNLINYPKNFFRIFINPIRKIITNIWDKRLNSYFLVKENKNVIFKLYDFGPNTRMRGSTFESKEPETINWIKSFKKNDLLFDIGANIGVYSLYAAKKGINVISIEPDSLNYALINLNIKLNNYEKKITAYCIALHNKTKLSKLNISSLEWGGALNSFDNSLDYKGNKFVPKYSQGVFGCSLDFFVKNLSLIPDHIKIDVDGNEYLILLGATKLLKNLKLKTLLIELDESREDYNNSIDLIINSGFKLMEKSHAPMQKNTIFSKTYNHMFYRK